MSRITDKRGTTQQLQLALDTDRHTLSTIQELYADGNITEDEYTQQLKVLNARIQMLDRALNGADI